ncbi:MAG: M48 family metalloprotease [Actinomycetota bacterium]
MYEQISSNKRKTVLLVAGAFVVLGALGFALGYVFASPQEAVVWMVIGLAIAGIQSFFSLRYGDKLVLASTRARPVSHEEAPQLHNVVEGMAIAAGLPKPAVYIVPEQAPNAYATGRDPEHSSIAVTQGLLEVMNRVELEGVIAHEMSHIQDRDMLVGTVVATLVGAVVLISEFFLRWMWIGGRRSSNDSGGSAGLIFAVIGILLLVLAPVLSAIVQAAVSRQREKLADANGALLTRYPPGLVAALKKLAISSTAMRSANNATAHLWLNQPSRFQGEKTGFLERLFNTHPPLEERIRLLEEM